ncbi:hypothetical protein KAI46_10480 [bacterium]|nr:hypothetical protein [bacterium]
MRNQTSKYFQMAFLLFLSLCLTTPGLALDTDVYQPNDRPNVAILFDNSKSMDYGLHEHGVDYGACYDDASNQGHYHQGRTCDETPCENPYYHQFDRDAIYFIKGELGVAVVNNEKAYSGDAGYPEILWMFDYAVPTYTALQTTGSAVSFVYDDTNNDNGVQLLTTINTDDNAGEILFEGIILPKNRSIQLQENSPYPDGTPVDVGFAGQLIAPGWYFSGYSAPTKDSDFNLKTPAEDGHDYAYFFATGNWLNMQAVYMLYENAAFANDGDEDHRTWETTTFDQTPRYSISTNIKSINYP